MSDAEVMISSGDVQHDSAATHASSDTLGDPLRQSTLTSNVSGGSGGADPGDPNRSSVVSDASVQFQRDGSGLGDGSSNKSSNGAGSAVQFDLADVASSVTKIQGLARGARQRTANQNAASKANDDLHGQLHAEQKLWTQGKDASGATSFEQKSDGRNQRANESGAFWSGSIKDTPELAMSGEHQAEQQTEDSGRMMSQTDLHKGAIEFIRKTITTDVYNDRRAQESDPESPLYKEAEKDRLPEDGHAIIQKDPENNLVYNHFRTKPDDVFFQAWGSSSEDFATGLGDNMVPATTNGAQGHRKFDDTVQIKYELPAFVNAATDVTGKLNDASRLNQIAALGGRQLNRAKDDRGGAKYEAAEAQHARAKQLGDGQAATKSYDYTKDLEMGGQAREGKIAPFTPMPEAAAALRDRTADPDSAAKMWQDGVDAQAFDSEEYLGLNPVPRPPEERAGDFWKMKPEEQKNAEQQKYTEDYDTRSYAGTEKMKEGRSQAVEALAGLRD
jgi:hypothetical protein